MPEIIGPSCPWAEITKFIWYRKLAALGTSTLAGEPRVDPVLYASDERYIYVTIIPGTRKLGVLGENNKVAVAIFDPYNEDWARSASIIIRGEAELIDSDSDEYEQVVNLMKGKYPQVQRRGVIVQYELKAAPIIKIDLEKAKISTGAIHGLTDEEMRVKMEDYRKSRP